MKKKIICIVLVLVLILSVSAGLVFTNREKIAVILFPEIATQQPEPDPEPVITVDYIHKELQNISTLETAKITYGCIIDFEDGEIPILNKKSFSMYYEVTTYAGIEIKDIDVEEKDGIFIIKLPEAKIGTIDIDAGSVELFDKGNSLFNSLSPEDATIALQYAEKDALNQATTDQLLGIADKNAKDVISNFLRAFNNEIKFEVVAATRTETQKIKLPIGADDVIGANYNDIKDKFEEAGFTNITCEPIKDLTTTIFTKDGEIEKVTVDGKDTFKKSNVFASDTEIIITFHTMKNK